MYETRNLSAKWEFIADTVMGGVSTGVVTATTVDSRPAYRLTGQVSLENNGGFVQMAFDLNSNDSPIDASLWAGIELDVFGNEETYEARLRTSQLTKPWQSFRTDLLAGRRWKTVRLPFGGFTPHRHDLPFDPTQLRRIGVLAIGREFQADVAVADLRLYR